MNDRTLQEMNLRLQRNGSWFEQAANTMTRTLIMLLGTVLLTGSFTAKAQKLPGNTFRTWEITSSAFVSLREGGKSFLLDSKGNLVKRRKDSETKETVKEEGLQEIVRLLQDLDLPRTVTKSVKGKRIHDYPYWNFTIVLDGKSFLMEGFSFGDTKVTVLTEKRKQNFAKLKEKLSEVGAER